MGNEKLDQPALSPAARLLAESEVARLLREVAGLTAAVVATVDGLDVASAMRGGDASRVAALAGSLAAIGGVVSQEARLGRSRSVTIDTESGFAVVHTVYRGDLDLVVNLIADGSAILGQVAYQATQFARALAAA